MDIATRRKIQQFLDQHRIMSVATLRPDGWPQATTVGYLNKDLTLYFLCSPESQKARNLARDDRLWLTIDHDMTTGLSMAARARIVHDRTEAEEVLRMVLLKYPRLQAQPLPFRMPTPDEVCIFRVAPFLISVVNYTKGFGDTDQVVC